MQAKKLGMSLQLVFQPSEESKVYLKNSCRWCLQVLVVSLMGSTIYKFYLSLNGTALNLVKRASNVVQLPALSIFISNSKIAKAPLYVTFIIVLAGISK